MVKGTGLKKRRPLFRLIPCTFPSPSSALSRLHPLHLPVFILSAFPSSSSAAFLSSSSAAFLSPSSAPSTSLTLASPYPPTSPRYRLVLCCLLVFVLCCLLVFILCSLPAFPPPFSAAFLFSSLTAFPSSSSAPSRLYPLRLPHL